MSKLYHLKSDHEREMIGEQFAILDKVVNVHLAQKCDEFVLVVTDVNDNNSKAWFKSKDNALAALRELVLALGGSAEQVDAYVIKVINDKRKDELINALQGLRQAIER